MGLTIDEAKELIRLDDNADDDDGATGEALVRVYESFGGLEAFTAPKLSVETKELRNLLLASPQFPVASFVKVVERTLKFSRRDVESITSWNPKVFLSFPIFLRFWEVNPKAMMHVIWWLSLKSLDGELSSFGKQPFWADAHLEDAKAYQTRMLAAIDPRIIEIVQDGIFRLPEDLRAYYAGSCFIHDGHWRKLAVDKRNILNALTYNPLLPTDIATEIALAHKTTWVRENIARYTTSPELLQIIWDSTKSEYIRATVKANKFFVPLS